MDAVDMDVIKSCLIQMIGQWYLQIKAIFSSLNRIPNKVVLAVLLGPNGDANALEAIWNVPEVNN